MENPIHKTNNSTLTVDTKLKLTGDGGVFFCSENSEESEESYIKNFGH